MRKYVIKLIDNIESFQKIEEEWNDLLSRCVHESIFSRYDYNYIAWKYFHKKNDSLFIILFYQDDILQAIAPFCITRQKIYGIPVRRIDYIAAWEGDKPSIVAPGNEEVIWDEISLFLKNDFHAWDVLNVMEQPSWSSVLTKSNFLYDKKFFYRIIHDSTSYFIDMNCTWDDYFSTLSSNVKKKWRRYSKKLRDDYGDFTLKSFQNQNVSVRRLTVLSSSKKIAGKVNSL